MYAAVVLARGGSVLDHGRSDSIGLLALEDGCATAEVYIDCATTIHGAAVQPGPNQHRIVVPEDAVISGRVEIENGRRPEKLALEVIRDRDDPQFEALPRAVQSALWAEWRALLLPSSPFQVRADGTFRLTGFTHGWREAPAPWRSCS
jgi:hypothetical protein